MSAIEEPGSALKQNGWWMSLSGPESPSDETSAIGVREESTTGHVDADVVPSQRAGRALSRLIDVGYCLLARNAYQIIVMAGAFALFVVAFGSLQGLTVPLGRGDLLPSYATADVWSDGTRFGNTSYGFPFGMQLQYFPTTDILTNGLAGLIGAVTDNPFLGINVVYALSFPATALATYWVLGIAKLRGPVAVVMSLALTFIPFHWYRLEHVYLATMYSAVLGVGLALLIGTGSVERRLGPGRRWRGLLPLLGIALVIASSGIYYAFFTVVLCLAALAYRFAHGVHWRGLAHAAVPVAAIVVFTALALAPAWLYVHANPADPGALERLPSHSVFWGGALALALLPAPFSKIPGSEGINSKVLEMSGEATRGNEALGYSNYGSMFTVLALVLFCVGGLVVHRRRSRMSHEAPPSRPDDDDDDDCRVAYGLVGTLLVAGLLFFMTWGVNFLFASLVTSQIRSWNRVLPMLFVLVFTGAAVTWRSLGWPVRGTGVAIASVACIQLVILDSVLPYQANMSQIVAWGQQEGSAAESYADALNSAIPGDCAVLELPSFDFPEGPVLNTLNVYGPLLPAITNPEKHWTFGAMKGTRADDWLQALTSTLDSSDVEHLVSAGFCAVHVDLRGYSPEEGSRMTDMTTELLGPPVVSGNNNEWLAFALPTADAGELVDLGDFDSLPDDLQVFFSPPAIVADPQSGVQRQRDVFRDWWWIQGGPVAFDISATDDNAEFTEVTGQLQAADCSPRTATVDVTSNGKVVSDTIELGQGETREFTLHLGEAATTATLTVGSSGDSCVADGSPNRSVALVNPGVESLR